MKKSINDSKQIEEYKQASFPQELAENIGFIESIEDFPFLVSLTVETNQTFLSILQTYSECNTFLDLDEVYRYLKNYQLDDYWEEKVCIDLQNDLKKITASMIKEITKNEITVADFFSDGIRTLAFQQYQHIIQKIKALSSPNLMPYIALKKALAKLFPTP